MDVRKVSDSEAMKRAKESLKARDRKIAELQVLNDRRRALQDEIADLQANAEALVKGEGELLESLGE